MEEIKTIFLAIVQGVTEFLPISSSGHIVFLKEFFTNSQNSMTASDATLEVVLHLGTLISILIFFRKDIIKLVGGLLKGEKESSVYSFYIIVATIPAVLFVLITRYAGYDIESSFSSNTLMYTFLVNAIILYATRYTKTDKSKITLILALVMGLAQIIALFPGISRSGITICIALLLGYNQKSAAKFSFFMFIPALLGALVLKFNDIQSSIEPGILILGFLFSMITGLFVLKLLFRILEHQKLWMFSFYSILIWLISIIKIYNG